MTLDWSAQAKADIQEIIDFYLPVAGMASTAKIVQKIYVKAQVLLSVPQIGQAELLLEGNPKNYRRLIAGNYKIVYYIDGNTVHIASVFDTRRNPAALRTMVEKSRF